MKPSWLVVLAAAGLLALALQRLRHARARRTPRGWSGVSEVEWRVPVGCDFSGFFTEVALGFLPPLHRAEHKRFKLLSGACTEAFLNTYLTEAEAATFRDVWVAEEARSKQATRDSIVIEHGDPCGARAWPRDERPRHVVMRAMSEGDLAAEAAACLLLADEVWVPTEWHVGVFAAAGVPRRMLHVIAEPVDTALFTPTRRRDPAATHRFIFLSSFKWEWRKGWDLLLRAYWAEFHAADSRPTLLRLKTYLPSWEAGPADLNEWLDDYAIRHFRRRRSQLAPVELCTDDLSREALRDLYEAADAFVLPTRGEGWGLPIAEAMAMELPVIATNWSGPMAFLSPTNSFALPVARHLAEGRAEPSVAALRERMRAVVADEDSILRGKQARRDMVARFSPEVVAQQVLKRLAEIEAARKLSVPSLGRRPEAL